MKKILLIAFVGLFGVSFAQQSPLSNIYNKNRILLNPANTGDQGHLAGFINYRNQWVGNSGAPNAQFIGLHSPLTDRVHLGGVIQNHQHGLIRQTSGQMNYGYLLPIDEEHKLRFGLGAAFYQHGLNLANAFVEDPSEYGLFSGDLNGIAFNASFGVVYQWRDLEVGVAMPNFLPFASVRVNPENDPFFMFQTELMAHASYRYEFDNNIALQPLVVARMSPNRSYVFDNWVYADYKNLLWMGLGYRTQTMGSFMVSVGTWLTKNINFNYAYEFSNSPYGALSLGTHEISLGFSFNDAQTVNPFTALVRENKPERYEKKVRTKSPKKSKNKKKITIITEGYNTDADDSPDIEFKVTPNEGRPKGNSPSATDSAVEDELVLIKSRLDLLLKDQTMSKSDLKWELGKIASQLNDLNEKNTDENSKKVSKDLEDISKQIESLKSKIDKL